MAPVDVLPLPVFPAPVQPGSTVLRGAMASALLASPNVPTLDLRDLPRPPALREDALTFTLAP